MDVQSEAYIVWFVVILVASGWGIYKITPAGRRKKKAQEAAVAERKRRALMGIHQRGSQLTHPDALAKKIAPDNEGDANSGSTRKQEHTMTTDNAETRLALAGIPLPERIETQHLLLEGSTGTGKSTALRAVVPRIRQRGDRAVIVDPAGEMMCRYWQPGDVILNPLDARSAAWSPFAEVGQPSDADRLAKSMIPDIDGGGDSQQWQLYSQNLVSAVLQKLWEGGQATNADLVHSLTILKSEDLEPIVAGTMAQTLFDVGAAKMLSNVRGIIGSYLPAYRFLPSDADGRSWSIRRWVESGQGWLWIPVRADMMAAMRPLVAAWLGEIVSSVLSLRPDRDRRLWLVLDELAALGRIQSLADALTQGRKFGLCSVGGLQTVAQLRGAYGQHGAQTLLSCFSSQLILRAADPETASWCSQALGQRQIKRTVESSGVGAGGSHSGESEQVTIEPLVLPSEISTLPDLQGYLKFAGNWPVARVTIPLPDEIPEVRPPFVPAGSAPAVPRGTPTAAVESQATANPAVQADAATPAPAEPDPGAELTEQFRKLLSGESSE